MSDYAQGLIEETGDFRVRVVYDESQSEFPDFVQSAVISMNDRYLSYNDTRGLGALVRREWSERLRDFDVIDRWLKIFHGVRAVSQVDTRDATYLVLLTEDARWYYGTPEDRVQECADGDAETFMQWAEGDIYGYVVEERATWRREGGDEETMETWEEVDSLWDLYGHDYASTEAREALTSWAGDAAAA
ncbi:hypothetical protein [Kribbella italica]|uniref:Uncharacterized protein n=1 Tax=Kribbella italica TaxID=1540520 RepID=A0A7W9J0J9_9ACTN|nr:hypothetical protein [Kribbella italica]MBB5833437.1 hypothetical protein [Kribbella italica]